MSYIQSRINDRVMSNEYLVVSAIKDLGFRYENPWSLVFDEDNELGLLFKVTIINSVIRIIVGDEEFDSIRVSSIWNDDLDPIKNANAIKQKVAKEIDNLIDIYT